MLNKVRFDWFSFTIKGKTLPEVMEDLGQDLIHYSLSSFGRYGYQHMLVDNEYAINIMYDGLDGMGIHVSIPGGAVKPFLQRFYKLSPCFVRTPFGDRASEYEGVFKTFAAYVLQHGRFSRVDVNIDTDIPFFSPRNIYDLAQHKECITLYRHWELRESCDNSATVYFGQRESSSLIRIYDKAKEQGDFESTLYRFEVQFNKRADAFMEQFLAADDLSAVFRSFIEKQIRFTPDQSYDGSLYSEWDDFLALMQPDFDFFSYDQKVRKNCIKSLMAMHRQYRNIYADFLDFYGDMDDFVEFMVAVLDAGDNDFKLYQFIGERGWNI